MLATACRRSTTFIFVGSTYHITSLPLFKVKKNEQGYYTLASFYIRKEPFLRLSPSVMYLQKDIA
ncbi:hypothetical protein M422DRAFT_227422 [Sphaerobolus stellatus SS14]|uniref:Uncharacterized protein n=1 Tax=Sphaerobolus stellatus (strain SS14) TaxID=990650 RepID=A0A0C9VT19_SPHS4|nr:hypothetical protein M422DRAFT_227422 [Sphaerobolus stellatus SS14]